METGFQRTINSSGHEGHGVHVCHKCGWPFPNPHPSAKHRRAHKRICGTIEGYKLGDSGENKTHLDASDDEHQSDDDSKNPSNGLKAVEKTAEMSIARRSSNGVCSRLSRPTRSDEDVFSDAVTEFDDVPGVTDSVDVVREPASVMPDISEDDGVTQLAVENAVADAGDLYPPNSAIGTQLQTVECFRPENERVEMVPENERVETDMPSQHHLSSSTVDSIPTSGLDSRGEENSVSKNILQSSKIAVVLDSQEKGSVEAALDKKSEVASILTEDAGETSEAVCMAQKLNGDNLVFVPADASMEVVAKQGDGFDDKDDWSPGVNLVGQTCRSEKGGVESALDKKSEDIVSLPTENASKTSEAVSVPKKVDGDSLEFVPADAAMEVITKRGDEFHDKNDCSPEVNIVGQTNSSEKGGVEAALDKKSEGIASSFAPSEVNGDNLEFKPACAAMEVIGKQGNGFDAKDDCSPENGFAGKINSLGDSSQAREDANVKAGSFLEIFEGHGSCNDSVDVVVVPQDDLPLGEHSKVMLEDHKTEKLPAAIAIDLDQEVKGVEHGKVYTFTSISSAEPSESPNRNFEDIISEALHKEDNSAEDVSVENEMEKAEPHTTDADTSTLSSVSVVDPDKDGNDVGQGKVVTSVEEQNPLVVVDTNLLSVLDDSGNQTQSIRGVKPVHDGLEHDSEEAEFSDALEAETTKVAGGALSLTSATFFVSDNYVTSEKNLLGGGDKSDYDVRSKAVEENLTESTPSVPQSDDQMDNKAEIERSYYEHAVESSNASLLKCDVQRKKLQHLEAAVEDLGSSSEQMVGGECASAVGASAISSFGNNVDMTEQTHNDENCVHKASDSVSLLNIARDNDAGLVNIEVSKGAEELEIFGEKMSGGVGSVDLGLISDNDESIDQTQCTANGVNVGVHEEAVSAVEHSFTKEIDGRASGFTDGDRKLVKQEETVPELNIQVDSSSQTDSLECNWGSVSVLSAFSDAPAATDTGSQLSQVSLKVEKASLQPKSDNGKTDIFEPPSLMSLVEEKADGGHQNEGASEAQPSNKPQEQAGWFPSLTSGNNESSGRKKNKEIIEKVANWSTEKQRMPLKSYLGESSPSAKDNPPLWSQKTERMMMDTKEPVDETAMGEMRKEWNSPARYPANIKREKGKVRSRPYWAPFICCSSVQTS